MLPTPTRHLQIQFQQVADASDPDQASTNPIPANCRCFRTRPGICKSNSSKLQILPHPEFTPICIYKSNTSKLQMLPNPTRHLQIQYQQIADASEPDQASANPIPANCRCFRTQDMYLQIHIQQIADASNPGQASANPIPASCRCFQPQSGICKSNFNKLQMLPTPTRHLQIQFQQVADTSTSGIHPYMYLQVQFQQIADASNPGQASAAPIPASCRCFRP